WAPRCCSRLCTRWRPRATPTPSSAGPRSSTFTSTSRGPSRSVDRSRGSIRGRCVPSARVRVARIGRAMARAQYLFRRGDGVEVAEVLVGGVAAEADDGGDGAGRAVLLVDGADVLGAGAVAGLAAHVGEAALDHDDVAGAAGLQEAHDVAAEARR